MYTILEEGSERKLIVKGAPDNIMELCKNIPDKRTLRAQLISLNNDGLRMVAVATKKLTKKEAYTWDDVKDLCFEGYITFLDVPKKSAKEALEKLHALNVQTKIITGDNEIITQKICREVGIPVDAILLGNDLEKMSDEELMTKVNDVDIFARVNPEQKTSYHRNTPKTWTYCGIYGRRN